MSASTTIVGYLALFVAVGFGFVLLNLLIGRFLRPANPSPEKQEIYECGEPTIGSSFVQFDLRFYVVALVFIVFDVEVAFMFPWATVYGKALHLRTASQQAEVSPGLTTGENGLTDEIRGLYRELGVANPSLAIPKTGSAFSAVQTGANDLVWLSAGAMAVFFFVLLLGFAYEWKTGAMDWVRAITPPDTASLVRAPPAMPREEEPALTN